VYQVDPHCVYVTPPAGTEVGFAHGGAGAGGGGVAGAVANWEGSATGGGGGGALAADDTAATVPATATPVAAIASPLPSSQCWSS